MRESTKVENTKTTKRSNNTNKSALNKSKESSSCGSCGVCRSMGSPRLSSESAASALSHAKATGKESCAISFMQKNHGNRYMQQIANSTNQRMANNPLRSITNTHKLPSAISHKPLAISRKCSCSGSCARCKGEEEAERISMSIMKKESCQPSAVSFKSSADSNEQTQISEIMSSKGSGHGLDDNTRSFMGERFGYNFSHVRLHNDSYAARKSNELNAEAFTIGRDVFFNAGRYNPSSAEGKKLLAHELTHVVQQGDKKASTTTIGTVLQCAVSYDECTSGEETIVLDSHNRAMNMVATAVRKLGSYNGTTPADVRNALNTHFHSTGTGLAMWIAFNLNWLKGEADSPTYECEKPQIGRRLGWSMWCVPWTDIELYPLWFAESDIDKRSRTMIHEWVHRYGCNFDLGYEWEQGYSGHGTLRSLLNADPWAHFVYDVR